MRNPRHGGRGAGNARDTSPRGKRTKAESLSDWAYKGGRVSELEEEQQTQSPNMDKTTSQRASVPKDVLSGGTRLGNGVEEQAGVNRPVPACRYYDSDGSDPDDDGEVRAKGPADSNKARVPYYTQPGTPQLPAHYRTTQTQNTGGQQQPQPGRGQSSYLPAHAQRSQPTTSGHGQGGQFLPSAAPHTAQQQRTYNAPPPGGHSQAGYSHQGGNPQAAYPQSSATSRRPAAAQQQPAAQKPAQKNK